MIWSKLVATTVTRGYAAKRGAADNAIVPAVDGTVPSFLVLAEGQSDVGTTIPNGQEAPLLFASENRDWPAKVTANVQSGQFLMPTADGSLIVATSGNYYCAQALDDQVSGAICRVKPVQGKMP